MVTASEPKSVICPLIVIVEPLPIIMLGPTKIPPVQVASASKSAPFVVVRPLAMVSGLYEINCFTVVDGTEMLVAPNVPAGRQATSVENGW